eukprot:scaffold4592_cov169-Ochromonas_danica.AAC.5
MSRGRGRHFDASVLYGLVVVDHVDFVNAVLQVLLIVKRRVSGVEADVVGQQQLHDGLGRVRHEDLAFEVRPLREVRQRGAVVDVEVCDEDEVDVFGVVQRVEERQRVAPFTARMATAVQQDVAALILQQNTRATHLLTAS